MKSNIIIIAKCKEDADLKFYKLLYNKDHELDKKAVVYLFSQVEQFDTLINSCNSDFRFSLLVHVGADSEATKYDGELIIGQLKQLPYFDKLNFEYTSRKGKYVEGFGDAVYTVDMIKPEFNPASLKSNVVGVLRKKRNERKKMEAIVPFSAVEEMSPAKKELDFAILTALYQDEHKAFDANMKIEKVDGEKNLKVGTFLPAKNFKGDYRKQILLSWQQDLGMVDAAAFSSRLIAKHNPRFLIMGGVCGGREGEVSLYDIIIPRNIFDYMSGKFKKGNFEPRPLRAEPSQELVDYLETESDTIKAGMLSLVTSTATRKIIEADFKIHFKNYACGPWVVKTQGKLLQVAKTMDDDIIGLEMESLGVIRASKLFSSYKQYGIIVKSVMDYTDVKQKRWEDGYNKGYCQRDQLLMRAVNFTRFA